MSIPLSSETIVAIATPAGRGGVGIVRLSGANLAWFAEKIIGFIPKPRSAVLSNFKDLEGNVIDQGICLYFPKPHSFTGEDVLELQGHGGPVVLDTLLHSIIQMGARLALPGEFSKRAFLNNKIDLIQAESIADLIDAGSKQAAKSALKSLQGEFSNHVQKLLRELIELRMFIEAAIDFPEEEIDFMSENKVSEQLAQLITTINNLKHSATQGVLLQEGMTIVLVGQPNVGKSSLLNCLSGRDTAIVTEVAGTTRDLLREYIHIDGLPLHIIDTAGLRKSEDKIEKEGIRRTHQAILQADIILLLIDATQSNQTKMDVLRELNIDVPSTAQVLLVRNKIDLLENLPSSQQNLETTLPLNENNLAEKTGDVISISAKYNLGINVLKNFLKQKMGYEQTTDGIFTARRRHLIAIEKTHQHLLLAKEQLDNHFASELVAEELVQAQQALAEITGEFTADDLLTHIFSSFCIGK